MDSPGAGMKTLGQRTVVLSGRSGVRLEAGIQVRVDGVHSSYEGAYEMFCV